MHNKVFKFEKPYKSRIRRTPSSLTGHAIKKPYYVRIHPDAWLAQKEECFYGMCAYCNVL